MLMAVVTTKTLTLCISPQLYRQCNVNNMLIQCGISKVI